MFSKITTPRLQKAGFQLETYDDGQFWTIELPPGEAASRLLHFCKLAIDRIDAEAVTDVLVLQCNSDFTEPTLFIDNYLWPLTKQDFAQIVRFLQKKPKERKKPSK